MHNKMSPNILRLCQCSDKRDKWCVRVLDLIVYYIVTRMDMHVSITVRQKVFLVGQLHDEQYIILGYEFSQ